MTFQQAITERCTAYAKDASVRFIGYNTVYGSRMYGTLNHVEPTQCIESPIAENLMVGMAVGMAIDGLLPVVCFERHDFALLGLDALVNHVDKLPLMSGNKFKLPVIIRCIVGGRTPIDPGPMHRQDYTRALQCMLRFTPVRSFSTKYGLDAAWNEVGKTQSGAVVIIEHKDDYALDINGDL